MEIKQLPTFGCEHRVTKFYPKIAEGHYVQKFIAPSYDSLIRIIEDSIQNGVPGETTDFIGVTTYLTGGIQGDPGTYYMVQPTTSSQNIDYPHYFICKHEHTYGDDSYEYITYICFIPKNLLP